MKEIEYTDRVRKLDERGWFRWAQNHALFSKCCHAYLNGDVTYERMLEEFARMMMEREEGLTKQLIDARSGQPIVLEVKNG